MMKWPIAVSLLVLGVIDAGSARAANLQRCTIEVLHSEFLSLAPLFSHTVKATLLVSTPGKVPIQVKVVEVIPWQVPPPRQGQKLRRICDPAGIASGSTAWDLF